jgi:DNA-binding winged helix-turn-helix (wHTH) protein
MNTLDPVPAVLRFGRCELSPHHRELHVDGNAVHLGGRAFDLLMVLVDGRGELVTKDEILSRVWPGVIVEENTLQVQISALRKAMGNDRDCVKTICGRGYRFIAEVTTANSQAQDDPERAVVAAHAAPTSINLPTPLTAMIGSETELSRVLDLISAAVELAAACLPARGVEELARRLDDRLRLLSGGRRTALPHHQLRCSHESTEHLDRAALAH